MAQGRLAEAEQTCREAILLDPLVTILWYNLGRLAVAAGRYQDAEEIFRKGLEIQPHAARFHTYLATLDILQKNPTAALQQAQLEPDDFWREYALTLVQQTQPDRDAADTALKNFSSKYATNGAYQIAVIHALRKEPDEMFRWLDNAYATHDSGLTQLVITPFVFEYRDDPRFVALCQKLGVQLPRPWRTMNEKHSFFAELKRRNVYKVAVAYIVGGWALSQGIAQVLPVFDIPNWIVRVLVILIVAGFPIALVIAWAFEATPEGIKRTAVADAASERSRGKAWIYVVIAGAPLSIGLFFLGRYTAGNATPRHDARTARTEAAATPQKSVAVLPLVNESGDPSR